jgi:preprotein translocase subunit YajC
MLTLQFLWQAAGGLTEILTGLMPFFLIIIVIYFFFLRPQMKKQKEQGSFVQNLQKGDEVVTSSGIVGRINKVEDQFVMLQIDQKTFIKILTSAVSKEMTDSLNNKDNAKS